MRPQRPSAKKMRGFFLPDFIYESPGESATSLPVKVRPKAVSNQGNFLIDRCKKYELLFDLAHKMKLHPTAQENLLALRLQKENIPFAQQCVLPPYIVDFLLRGGLVLELDGKQHDRQLDYDLVRDSYLMKFGFIIHRIPNIKIEKNLDKVICDIREFRKNMGTSHRRNNKKKMRRLINYFTTGNEKHYVYDLPSKLYNWY